MHKKVTKIVMSYRSADFKAKLTLAGRMAEIIGTSERTAGWILDRLEECCRMFGQGVNRVAKGEGKTEFSIGPDNRPGSGVKITFTH